MKEIVRITLKDGKILEKEFEDHDDAYKVKQCYLDAVIRNKNENVRYIQLVSKPENQKEKDEIAGIMLKAMFQIK